MRTLNVGIVAHVDAGRTSLTERLVHAAGVIAEVGSVDAGSTQTDSLAQERRRGITIRAAGSGDKCCHRRAGRSPNDPVEGPEGSESRHGSSIEELRGPAHVLRPRDCVAGGLSGGGLVRKVSQPRRAPGHPGAGPNPEYGHGAAVQPQSGPTRLVVEGERFDVRERPGVPGQYDFTWLSGPNDGYGFTSASSDGSASSPARLEAAIRGFLAQIDPRTGYIG